MGDRPRAVGVTSSLANDLMGKVTPVGLPGYGGDINYRKHRDNNIQYQSARVDKMRSVMEQGFSRMQTLLEMDRLG
jgi:hypothetical protein